jgi:restriction system protein
MQIPDYQTLMLPLLRLLSDGKEKSLGTAIEALSNEYKLSSADREALLPSGKQTIIRNRVGWARTYMRKAGLIDPTRRGFFKITERGKTVLASNPAKVDVRFLEQFPEFIAFRDLHHKKDDIPEAGQPIENETPEEALDAAYQRLRESLESEILQQVKAASPTFFERLVVELLVSMGYGGDLQDAGKAVGHAGDGGVDGIIKEDRLGLDAIYIQAKRWEATVGRPEIQKFAGVLQGHRARKGVFITTSDFSKEATDFVDRIDSRIVLIDGPTLARLMVDHDVGVSVTQKYEVKKVDSDYFEEE